jgi:hypothetical protein
VNLGEADGHLVGLCPQSSNGGQLLSRPSRSIA